MGQPTVAAGLQKLRAEGRPLPEHLARSLRALDSAAAYLRHPGSLDQLLGKLRGHQAQASCKTSAAPAGRRARQGQRRQAQSEAVTGTTSTQVSDQASCGDEADLELLQASIVGSGLAQTTQAPTTGKMGPRKQQHARTLAIGAPDTAVYQGTPRPLKTPSRARSRELPNPEHGPVLAGAASKLTTDGSSTPAAAVTGEEGTVAAITPAVKGVSVPNRMVLVAPTDVDKQCTGYDVVHEDKLRALHTCGERAYLVDMPEILSRILGLTFRFRKMLANDREAPIVTWGSTVTGVDEGDGWLKVSREDGVLFLPFSIQGLPVLTALDPVPIRTDDLICMAACPCLPSPTAGASDGNRPDLASEACPSQDAQGARRRGPLAASSRRRRDELGAPGVVGSAR